MAASLTGRIKDGFQYGMTVGKKVYGRFGGQTLEMLRHSNVGVPHLQKKVIIGRIVAKDESGYFRVETGFKRPVHFHEKEFLRGKLNMLAASVGEEVKMPEVGDEMRLLVRYIENPMGEMDLSNEEREEAERADLVWREIKKIHHDGGIVKGRVLNTVNGGYAVGIAGVIAFLPNQATRSYEGSTRPPVGELLPFKIMAITESTKNAVLQGPTSSGSAGADSRRSRLPWQDSSNRAGAKSFAQQAEAKDKQKFWRKKDSDAVKTDDAE